MKEKLEPTDFLRRLYKLTRFYFEVCVVKYTYIPFEQSLVFLGLNNPGGVLEGSVVQCPGHETRSDGRRRKRGHYLCRLHPHLHRINEISQPRKDERQRGKDDT